MRACTLSTPRIYEHCRDRFIQEYTLIKCYLSFILNVGTANVQRWNGGQPLPRAEEGGQEGDGVMKSSKTGCDRSA